MNSRKYKTDINELIEKGFEALKSKKNSGRSPRLSGAQINCASIKISHEFCGFR